jgi:hypothetical protein
MRAEMARRRGIHPLAGNGGQQHDIVAALRRMVDLVPSLAMQQVDLVPRLDIGRSKAFPVVIHGGGSPLPDL